MARKALGRDQALFLADGFSTGPAVQVVKAAGLTWLAILLIIALLSPTADP